MSQCHLDVTFLWMSGHSELHNWFTATIDRLIWKIALWNRPVVGGENGALERIKTKEQLKRVLQELVHIFGYSMFVKSHVFLQIKMCVCCLSRSALRKKRSYPKIWARQPPSSSSFSRPLRSNWPKRGRRWEHYKTTWKERWDSWF